jgi:ligand-binding sensor domain-containing protein/signal transduction histidine kinase
MHRVRFPPFIICLIVLILIASQAQAQYRFDSWTTDNGLPQNVVYAVTQTRDGYFWLTTFDGLVRYDGVRFTIFNRSNSQGLTSNRFSALFEDKDGTLWIGTIDGGLVRLRDGVFTSFTTADGLPNNWVHSLQREPNGDLLITTQGGFAYWRRGHLVADPERLDPRGVKLFVTSTGAHWRRDQKGLHRINDGQVVASFPIPLKELTRSSSRHLLEDREGNVWVGTYNDGIYRISGDKLTHFAAPSGVPTGAVISPHCQDRAGNIWFGVDSIVGDNSGGLLRFKYERFEKYAIAPRIPRNPVKTIFEDREGTLWVGTDGSGLIRVTRQFIKAYSIDQGLVSNNVYPIYEDRAGNIWIGAFGGLSRFKDGRFTNYTVKEGLLAPNVQALLEDDAGRLWMGGRASYFQDGKFHPPLGDIPLDGYAIYSIHQDRAGVLWLGTTGGLFKYDHGLTSLLNAADGVPSGDVTSIHQDSRGVLWFGTGNGLARLENNKFITLTVKDGMASNHVRCLYEDADGVLWIGTYDGGLSRYQGGRFVNYATKEGLFNDGVFQILEDGRGYFWMSCNRGIYRVSKQQLNDFAAGKIKAVTSISYSKQDGLPSVECNGGRQPAGIRASDGKLWFPTQGGVAVIDPNEVPTNPLPPPVMIESCLLDRQAVPFREGLRVDPGQSNLEINYTGLSFIKPEQVRFRYQLVGQDGDWIEAGTRRSANYSYLRPGDYTFKVIAANSDGIWNDAGAQMQIVVLPVFYQTWWFRVLALLAITGIIAVAFRWRLNEANRAHRAQEAFSRSLIDSQEQERKRIAVELHDSLGQDLLVIKNWISFGLATLDHDSPVRETLDEISEATAHAIEGCREISYNLRPHQMDYIGLTEALRAMLNRVAQASGLHIKEELADLSGVFPKDAEINLFRIVQESLNNIVKHAKATEVTVTVRRDLSSDNGQSRRAVIEIHDNGRGFEPASLTQAHRGMGLSGILERAQMLGGEAVIDSAPGRGTTVRVSIFSRIAEKG